MSDSHSEQEAPRYDDINTPVIVISGAIAAVVTLLTIFFVQGLAYHWQNDVRVQREVGPTSMPAVMQIAEQKAHLADESKVQLKIEDAMTKVIATHSK